VTRVTRRDRLLALSVALVARLAVVAWAADAIPPTADGTYYDTVARRIAEGHGYTWLWPDGAVTYAAHYPVGYPAIVAVAYAVFGAKPVVAMIVNALIGTLGVVAIHDLLAFATSRRPALLGALAVALHPALVPYTAALMTEGVTASLLAVAAAMVARAARVCNQKVAHPWRSPWLIATGLCMGVVTLVRPQSIVLAPVFGWFALARFRFDAISSLAAAVRSSKPQQAVPVRSSPDASNSRQLESGLELRTKVRARIAGAALASILALGVCAPWTVRNCVRMDRCALVSVNGGWNLAIGTETVDGSWHEMTVPDACKDVFSEAAKDACFGDAAKRAILRDPASWLVRIPNKFAVTFNFFVAAPWYLHSANPARFSYGAKVTLSTIETLVSRLLLAGALVSVVKLAGPRRRARMIICGVGLVSCVLVTGYVGYLACAIGIALLGRHALEELPSVVAVTAAVVSATALAHAVFFGAGRYGLVVVPFVTALAFVRCVPREGAKK